MYNPDISRQIKPIVIENMYSAALPSIDMGSDNIHQLRKKSAIPLPISIETFAHVIFSSATPRVPKQDKVETNNSIVGVTKSVPLVASPPKPKALPKAQLPPEEVEDAFLHVEFGTEYTESNDEELPEDELKEVIDTQEQIGFEDNIKIDRKLCIDYDQMTTSVRKVTRGERLDIEDDETMQKLEGTDIDTKLQQLLPAYRALVAERLSHTSN